MVAMIPVSYGMLTAYIGFVVVSTLLVGLLPPLVNRPDCKEDKALLRNYEDEIGIVKDIIPQDKPVDDTNHVRQKRYADAHEKMQADYSRTKSLIESRLDFDPVLRRHYNPQAASLERIGICSELLFPEVGVDYPWYSSRLPAYIQPINYKIEMLLVNLDFLTYDGFINITFGLNESTNLLIFHNGGNEIPLFQYLLDKDGNRIEIECLGAFLELRNDYFVMRTTRYLQPNEGPFTIDFLFIDFYTGIDDGIFRIRYGPKEDNQTMILSKFQPISARKAFPCFDEPGFKTTWDVTLYHREDFYVLFNTPPASVGADPSPGLTDTIFQTTQRLPTYFVAFATFNKKDFGALTALTANNVNITLYARKQFIDGGYAQDTLAMSVKIYDALSDIFRNVDPSAIPSKIDILAVPEYQVDAVAHYGFPIFEEDKLLFKAASSSERDLQTTGLLIAKIFAEFWFGNFITPHFWDELWVQEGFADYIKYRAVDEAYPTWNILDQFITEELIPTILLDGFPSSHPIQKPISNPYEIEEYFDLIESAKTAAILRMLEKEFPISTIYDAFTAFLNHDPWGIANLQTFYDALPDIGANNWDPEEFFDRWTLQSNYPLVIVELIDNAGIQNIKFSQYRGLNTNYSLFSDEVLYPSPWNFTWYIPIDCSFGNGSSPTDAVREREYYLDTKEATFAVPNSGSTKWTWVHCDRQFVGYMELDYSRDNWQALADGLKQGNPEFTAEDRAQIIHNLFQNSYTERGDYFQLRDLLDYMTNERDFLPWRVLDIQVARMDEILQYRRTFNSFANYIAYLARSLETSIDPWTAGEGHINELLKETAISLACRMQDSLCLNKVSELWVQLVPFLENGDFENSPIPAFARQIVYDYHIQNTYEIEDWDLIFRDYEIIIDENEHRKLLSSLTFSRLPWLLTGVINGIGNEFIRKIDFFLIMKYMVRNPLGRELAWDYLRGNFELLIETYSEDDPRLGTLLIDITESFETEFMFYELLSFVFFTTSGATSYARFKALEYCSTNIVWLGMNEEEIEEAFSAPRDGKKAITQGVSYYKNPLLDPIDRSAFDAGRFIRQAREALMNAINEDRSDVFAEYLIKKLAQ